MRLLLKSLGVVVIATAVVIVWHFGTTMHPTSQDTEIWLCALSARAELERRDTEGKLFPIVVRWGIAEKLFRDVQVSAAVSINGGPDTRIFCDSRDGKLRALMVDGDFLLKYGHAR